MTIRLRGRMWSVMAATALLLPAVSVVLSSQPAGAAATPAQTAAPITRTITRSGTGTLRSAAPPGADTFQNPEILSQAPGAAADAGNGSNRSLTGGKVGPGVPVVGTTRAEANPELVNSFDGLNHRDERLANGANQFSVEPPDQGLCVGNGFVMEALNEVVAVYTTSGASLTGPVSLNTFLGYAPPIVRPSGPYGPFTTDPSCLYDTATQRWFLTELTIETDPATGNFTGPNHLDIAVSATANPTGSWYIYQLPVQDDGTQGTPNHGCTGTPAGTGHGPCFGDYPHLGADTNGFYVTTNEYSFFGPEFHGAQIYAFSKKALAAGATNLSFTQIDTHGLAGNGNSGFTLWPATSQTGRGDTAANGTEYFLSSNAAAEAHGNGTGGPSPSKQLLVWAVTNTASLNTGVPALALSHTVVGVNQYAPPPPSNQKVGPTPLADCLNDTACATFLLGAPDPYAPEVEYKLDSNDTRMQQVSYEQGNLWGALDTAVTVGGAKKAGIEWFIVTPSVATGKVTATLFNQGYVAVAGNNVTYPAVGVTHAGKAVIAFTLVGNNYYPSAGYAGLDMNAGVTGVHVAANGAGPADGFTGYKAFGNPPGTIRPRWGDYGAAVPYGTSIWLASEYIGQSCTLAEYESAPFGSCNGTRTALANWDTRISQVSP